MFDPLPLLALTGAAIYTRCGILLVAMALDWLVGEPETLWRRAPHPVVIFGRGIGSVSYTHLTLPTTLRV